MTRPTAPPTSAILARVQRLLFADELRTHHPEWGAVADAIAARGLSPAIAEILSDPSSAEPVRLRALARAMALLGPGPTVVDADPHTADPPTSDKGRSTAPLRYILATTA